MKYIKVQKTTIQSMIDDAMRFAARQEIDEETLMNKAIPAIVCITFAKNCLSMRAHDFMYHISVSMKIECEEEAVLFLPAKLLQQAIAKADDTEISIGVDEAHLVVKSACGKTSLKSLSIEPATIYDQTSTHPTEMSGISFAHALGMVAFAAERKEERSSLCGVRVEFVGDNDILLVATDAYRIAKYQTSLDCSEYEQLKKNGEFTIPIKTVNNLIGVLSKITEQVEIGLDENHIAFRWKEGYISSTLVEGGYPNWRGVLPAEPKTTVSFAEGFQNAARAVKIMAKGTVQTCPVVTLEIKADETLFKSESDIGKSVISLTPTFTGDDLAITFNGDYLPDQIFGEVRIEMTAPLKPALFTSKSEPNWAYLISPLMIGSAQGK